MRVVLKRFVELVQIMILWSFDSAQDAYTAEGAFTPGPFALFSNMPPSRTLTMNLDVPEPWLVESVVAL